jgi:fructokinase
MMGHMTGVVAVIGEAVADAFPRDKPIGHAPAGSLELSVRPGGGPVNTAVALSRLGTPARFLGRLSSGLLGGLLREHLLGSNVDLSATVTADDPATLAITSVDTEGHTRFDFYLAGTTDWQWDASELPAGVLDGVCCVHTGSLALVLPPGGALIEELLAGARRDCVVSIDPNVRPGVVAARDYQAAIRRWSTLADIIRLSDEDLAVLRPDGDFRAAGALNARDFRAAGALNARDFRAAGALNARDFRAAGALNARDFDAACADWHASGVRLVVLTRGAQGATASLDGVQVSVPAVPTQVVDTVGAGDAFTAGLLHCLRRQGRLAPDAFAATSADDVAAAMRFAAVVAARVCAVRGADPPWREDLPQGEQ